MFIGDEMNDACSTHGEDELAQNSIRKTSIEDRIGNYRYGENMKIGFREIVCKDVDEFSCLGIESRGGLV
jgi:hypothetical protein